MPTNFNSSFSKSTGNCTYLTLTDTSNYSDNLDSITLADFSSRVFTIKDITGATLATLVIPAGEFSVQFPLAGLLSSSSSFLYVNITLNLFGVFPAQTSTSSLLPCLLP